ncbi:MAG: hypothetical protein PHE09_14415 [Oscillospiraceae bacterium]|nr:hypothetical protein [Oscillospiraceae bacterium]
MDNLVMPDSVEQLGKQFKHLILAQIDMISDMVGVMINHITRESGDSK